VTNVTHVQTVKGPDGLTTTVVVGVRRGQRIAQYIIRSLDAAALNSFERDLDVAVRRGEDPELRISAWVAVEE
jgi:hypothetical protein